MGGGLVWCGVVWCGVVVLLCCGGVVVVLWWCVVVCGGGVVVVCVWCVVVCAALRVGVGTWTADRETDTDKGSQTTEDAAAFTAFGVDRCCCCFRCALRRGCRSRRRDSRGIPQYVCGGGLKVVFAVTFPILRFQPRVEQRLRHGKPVPRLWHQHLLVKIPAFGRYVLGSVAVAHRASNKGSR